MQYLQEKYSIYATSIQSKVINDVYYNFTASVMCHHFSSHHLLTTDSRHAIVSIEKGAADRRSALSIQSYRMTAHLGLGAVISACYHFFSAVFAAGIPAIIFTNLIADGKP